MQPNLRKSGIPSLGNISWGTHLCQFYRTGKEQLDLLCSWFQAGLRNRESCLWISSESLKTDVLKSAMKKKVPGFSRYLKSGRFEIIPSEEWYLYGGRFQTRRVLDRWRQKLDAALDRGCAGLRAAEEPGYRGVRYCRHVDTYEAELGSLIRRLPILALCSYSCDEYGIGETLDVIRRHQCALIRHGTRWTRMEKAGGDSSDRLLVSDDPAPDVRSPAWAITERKRTEEELHESQRKLNILSSRLINAQEDERKRIAKELHDGIGQVLTAIKFGVENCMQTANCESAHSCRDSLVTVISAVQNGIDEIRRISADLWPAMLSDLGILPTVNWYCREFQSLYSGIRIAKMITVSEPEIPDGLKITLYRVLQEATNNAAKHSKADLVSLSLQKKDGNLELIIGDNGRGFDIEAELGRQDPDRGFGLSSMKERTELSGGSFSLQSAQGQGTVIRASWKL